jgi:hypothetical protein
MWRRAGSFSSHSRCGLRERVGAKQLCKCREVAVFCIAMHQALIKRKSVIDDLHKNATLWHFTEEYVFVAFVSYLSQHLLHFQLLKNRTSGLFTRRLTSPRTHLDQKDVIWKWTAFDVKIVTPQFCNRFSRLSSVKVSVGLGSQPLSLTSKNLYSLRSSDCIQ